MNMAENFADQLSRVRSMASGSDTWDLSVNDIAALKAVLKSHADLLAGAELALGLANSITGIPSLDETRKHLKRIIRNAGGTAS